ncbi:hypothetical protein D3C73_1421210 [compost metagenome]
MRPERPLIAGEISIGKSSCFQIEGGVFRLLLDKEWRGSSNTRATTAQEIFHLDNV